MPDDSQDKTRTDDGGAGLNAGEDPTPLKRLGDFELLRELGRGGMGVVYEARQISLKRRVALKVLPPALGMSAQAQQRFEREAQAAAKLHHTNIVPVHAIGEHDGHHFYAMDLIDGQSLDHVLRDMVDQGSNPLMEATVTQTVTELRPQRTVTSSQDQATTSLSDTSAGGREWFDTVAKLVADVAEALHYAHGRGVIHRDIKPANLMLSREGHLSITDFGLARLLEEPGMTVSGSFLGTPAYMAPEQIAAGRINVDHRADVYSLGAVLYEMLTMQRPFGGQSREQVLAAVMTKDPRPPRKFNGKIPVDLETICLKALEKDVDRRYATAGAMAQDLRQYLQGGLIAARRAGIVRRTWKSIRRHPTATTAIGLIIVGAATVAIVMTLHARSAAGREVERLLLEGQLAWETGQPGGLARAEEALTLAPDDPRARLLRARLLMQSQASRGVVQEARERLEQDPEDWVSHLILAHAGLNWYNPDLTVDAPVHVKAVEALAPESADAYYLRALVVTESRERLELLNRVLEIDPQYSAALTLRINTYRDLGDHQSALFDCDRLIANRPQSAEGHRMRSRVLQTMQDYPAALEAIERAITITSPDTQPGVAAWNYQARAEIHAAGGKYSEAIADLDRALVLIPDWSIGLRYRAKYRNRFGEHEEAAADARHVIELNPDVMLGGHQELLRAYSSLHDSVRLREALQDLGARSGSWPDDQARADADYLLARGYQVLGEYEESLKHFKKAVEAAPNASGFNVYAWELLTCDDADLRDPAAALELAIQANDLTEFSNASYLDTLALAYHRTGDTEKAIEMQRKAISLLPENADRSEYEKTLAEFESALDDEK